ncbi:cytochrome b/b6 domain-containing protein [Microbacterium gorillae]|uniref:cytochrome b/b6 domain-containing protein n=1 Tax=Microbacterium gorillae TaxID=1231063 RepID=UPI003D9679E1
MATYGTTVRRGLPRRAGGDAWPAEATVADGVLDAALAPRADEVSEAVAVSGDAGIVVGVVPEAGSTAGVADVASPLPHGDTAGAAPVESAVPGSAVSRAVPAGTQPGFPARIRQGLPRTAAGEPWPPADVVATVAAAAAAESSSTPGSTDTSVTSAASNPAAAPAAAGRSVAVRRGLPRTADGEPWPQVTAATVSAAAPGSTSVPDAASTTADVATPAAATVPAAAPAGAAAAASAFMGQDLRRGLPRTEEGEPWPPAGVVVAVVPVAAPVVAETPAPTTAPVASASATAAASVPAAVTSAPVASATAPSTAVAEIRPPLPFPRTVRPGQYAFAHPEKAEPRRIGAFTRAQWAGIVIVGGGALLALAYFAVFVTRFLVSLDPIADFLQTYPGEYDLPEGATPGFPAWAQWQHFFNIFLMVLIIRSGLGVRRERRPDAFWRARWSKDAKQKISLTLWFHQSLDILWLVNGLVFVVLLFASGHWMRIVPTSWEVFPNALSAGIQYVSLDWPTEHGWVNYNSLQQIMYFLTVFVAAPLAAITGVRMSGIWPKNAKALNKAYPVEIARAIHFPVMLYFVIFIVIHVVLVFATGALRNLNHMFGGTDEVNWNGFWIFFAGMVVIVGAVAASRTIVLAPIAKLFGTVTQR